MTGPEADEGAERIGRAVAGVETLSDPAARAVAVDALCEVLDLHSRALARILDALQRQDGGCTETLEALAADEVVTSVLLVHGLHPVPLRTRVERALESVRPLMGAHGGGVELLAVGEDSVRLRLIGSCEGCPSSTITLRDAVEKAIAEAAPDVASIEVEGATPAEPQAALRQLPVMSQAAAAPRCGDGLPVGR